MLGENKSSVEAVINLIMWSVYSYSSKESFKSLGTSTLLLMIPFIARVFSTKIEGRVQKIVYYFNAFLVIILIISSFSMIIGKVDQLMIGFGILSIPVSHEFFVYLAAVIIPFPMFEKFWHSSVTKGGNQ